MSRKLDLSALAAKAESGNNSSVKRIETLNMNIDELPGGTVQVTLSDPRASQERNQVPYAGAWIR